VAHTALGNLPPHAVTNGVIDTLVKHLAAAPGHYQRTCLPGSSTVSIGANP
jgi:hypothetical protein